MSLEGAQLICLDKDDNRGEIVLAKGRKFTVGYYVSCDFVLSDDRAKGVHCTIECDAFGRITIRNMSPEHPVLVNGSTVENKRNLFNKSIISILDKRYLWEFSSQSAEDKEDASSDDVSTPKKQIGIPEPTGFSSPGLKTKKGGSRFTVHTFAYCIQSDEDGNISIDLNKNNESTGNINEEKEEISQEVAQEPFEKPTQAERQVTPEPESGNTSIAGVQGTPKINLLNCTVNKGNTDSTQKKNRLQLSMCHQSEVVITSFSPRETGARTEKSFTAILLPKVLVTKAPNTPKSVYSTPKSLLDDDDDEIDSSRYINFHTPSTSKKVVGRAATTATKSLKNSSMHLVDYTTPKRFAPASPYLKSALKASAKKLPLTSTTEKILKSATAPEDQLGVSALPFTPVISDVNRSKLETPSSVQSVISVDSTDTSSVIEILSDESTPGLSAAKTPQKAETKRVQSNTPMRTPQSLMKRAILTNKSKQVTTPQRGQDNIQTTPRREPINRIPLRSSIAALRSPVTPTPTCSDINTNRRQSVSTPSRKSSVATPPRFESTPNSNTKFATPSPSRRSLMVKSASKATSTPLGTATYNKHSGCNTTPLNRVRKSFGGVPLSSHISKARKSIIEAAPSKFTSIKEKSPQQKMSDKILYRARKSSSVTPMVARAIQMVHAAKDSPNSILKQSKTPRKSMASSRSVLFADKQSKNRTIDLTFILDSDDEERNDNKVEKKVDETEDDSKHEEINSPVEKDQIVNLTFSPRKEEETQQQEKVPNTEETPVDVDEVPQGVEEVADEDSPESICRQLGNISTIDVSEDPDDSRLKQGEDNDDVIHVPLTSQATEESFAEEIIDIQKDELLQINATSENVRATKDPDLGSSRIETGFGEEPESPVGFSDALGVLQCKSTSSVTSELLSEVQDTAKVDSENKNQSEMDAAQPHDVLDKSSPIYKPIYEDITLESSLIEKEVKDLSLLNHSKNVTTEAASSMKEEIDNSEVSVRLKEKVNEVESTTDNENNSGLTSHTSTEQDFDNLQEKDNDVLVTSTEKQSHSALDSDIKYSHVELHEPRERASRGIADVLEDYEKVTTEESKKVGAEQATTCKLLEEIEDVLNKSDEFDLKHPTEHDDNASIPTLTAEFETEKLTQESNSTLSENKDVDNAEDSSQKINLGSEEHKNTQEINDIETVLDSQTESEIGETKSTSTNEDLCQESNLESEQIKETQASSGSKNATETEEFISTSPANEELCREGDVECEESRDKHVNSDSKRQSEITESLPSSTAQLVQESNLKSEKTDDTQAALGNDDIQSVSDTSNEREIKDSDVDGELSQERNFESEDNQGTQAASEQDNIEYVSETKIASDIAKSTSTSVPEDLSQESNLKLHGTKNTQAASKKEGIQVVFDTNNEIEIKLSLLTSDASEDLSQEINSECEENETRQSTSETDDIQVVSDASNESAIKESKSTPHANEHHLRQESELEFEENEDKRAASGSTNDSELEELIPTVPANKDLSQESKLESEESKETQTLSEKEATQIVPDKNNEIDIKEALSTSRANEYLNQEKNIEFEESQGKQTDAENDDIQFISDTSNESVTKQCISTSHANEDLSQESNLEFEENDKKQATLDSKNNSEIEKSIPPKSAQSNLESEEIKNTKADSEKDGIKFIPDTISTSHANEGLNQEINLSFEETEEQQGASENKNENDIEESILSSVDNDDLSRESKLKSEENKDSHAASEGDRVQSVSGTKKDDNIEELMPTCPATEEHIQESSLESDETKDTPSTLEIDDIAADSCRKNESEMGESVSKYSEENKGNQVVQVAVDSQDDIEMEESIKPSPTNENVSEQNESKECIDTVGAPDNENRTVIEEIISENVNLSHDSNLEFKESKDSKAVTSGDMQQGDELNATAEVNLGTNSESQKHDNLSETNDGNAPRHKMLEAVIDSAGDTNTSLATTVTATHTADVENESKEAFTPRRTSRRKSISAQLEVSSVKTPAEAIIETGSESALTPRRSSRRKSISSESCASERALTTLTPRRNTRRASMTVELKASHTPTTTDIKTRRASLSAVSETPLTPKRISRRRSSISIDRGEVNKIVQETKGSSDESTGIIFEDIKEDMGAIIEEEDEKEEVESEETGADVTKKLSTNHETTNNTVVVENKVPIKERDDEKVAIEENVCIDIDQHCDIQKEEHTAENLQTTDQTVDTVQDLTQNKEYDDEVASKSNQDLINEKTHVASDVNDHEQDLRKDEGGICEPSSDNEYVCDISQDEENMAVVVDVSVQALTEDEEIIHSGNDVQDVTPQAMTEDEETTHSGNDVQDVTPVHDKTQASGHDLAHAEGDIGEVVNVSIQDLTQDDDSICHAGGHKSVQDLTVGEVDIAPEIDLTKDEEALIQSEVAAANITADEDMESLEVSDDESIYDYGKEIHAPVTPKDQKLKRNIAGSPKTPVMTGMRKLLKTPKPEQNTPKLGAIRHLVRTPKLKAQETEEEESEKLQGMQVIVKTPTTAQSEEVVKATTSQDTVLVKHIEEIETESATSFQKGEKDLTSTPKSCATPRFKGIRELMKTPKKISSPLLCGVKELLDTPKPEDRIKLGHAAEIKKCSTPLLDDQHKTLVEPPTQEQDDEEELVMNQPICEEDSKGVKELLKTTPKGCSTPRFKGIRELMKTPKMCSTPAFGGIKELMDTPKQYKGSLDKFLKTPTAKNIMIPTLPSSAVIEKREDSVEMTHSIEYNLNDSHGDGSANLGELFKTPTASRFVDRLSVSYVDDDHAHDFEDGSTLENEGKLSPDLPTISKENTMNLQTPSRKVCHRKSLLLKTPLAESPFSAADVLTDLSTTEIEDWVDKIDPLEQTISLSNNDDVDQDKDDTREDSKIVLLDDSTTNDSLSVVPETCVKVPPANVSTSSEAMINISTVNNTTSKDPLRRSTAAKSKQEDKRPITPSETADISGIDLLDETTESVLEISLIVTDDDDEENSAERNESVNVSCKQDNTLCEEADNDLSEPLLLSDYDESEEALKTVSKNKACSKPATSESTESSIIIDLSTSILEQGQIEILSSNDPNVKEHNLPDISNKNRECEDIFLNDSVAEEKTAIESEKDIALDSKDMGETTPDKSKLVDISVKKVTEKVSSSKECEDIFMEDSVTEISVSTKDIRFESLETVKTPNNTKEDTNEKEISAKGRTENEDNVESADTLEKSGDTDAVVGKVTMSCQEENKHQTSFTDVICLDNSNNGEEVTQPKSKTLEAAEAITETIHVNEIPCDLSDSVECKNDGLSEEVISISESTTSEEIVRSQESDDNKAQSSEFNKTENSAKSGDVINIDDSSCEEVSEGANNEGVVEIETVDENQTKAITTPEGSSDENILINTETNLEVQSSNKVSEECPDRVSLSSSEKIEVSKEEIMGETKNLCESSEVSTESKTINTDQPTSISDDGSSSSQDLPKIVPAIQQKNIITEVFELNSDAISPLPIQNEPDSKKEEVNETKVAAVPEQAIAKTTVGEETKQMEVTYSDDAKNVSEDILEQEEQSIIEPEKFNLAEESDKIQDNLKSPTKENDFETPAISNSAVLQVIQFSETNFDVYNVEESSEQVQTANDKCEMENDVAQVNQTTKEAAVEPEITEVGRNQPDVLSTQSCEPNNDVCNVEGSSERKEISNDGRCEMENDIAQVIEATEEAAVESDSEITESAFSSESISKTAIKSTLEITEKGTTVTTENISHEANTSSSYSDNNKAKTENVEEDRNQKESQIITDISQELQPEDVQSEGQVTKSEKHLSSNENKELDETSNRLITEAVNVYDIEEQIDVAPESVKDCGKYDSGNNQNEVVLSDPSCKTDNKSASKITEKQDLSSTEEKKRTQSNKMVKKSEEEKEEQIGHQEFEVVDTILKESQSQRIQTESDVKKFDEHTSSKNKDKFQMMRESTIVDTVNSYDIEVKIRDASEGFKGELTDTNLVTSENHERPRHGKAMKRTHARKASQSSACSTDSDLEAPKTRRKRRNTKTEDATPQPEIRSTLCTVEENETNEEEKKPVTINILKSEEADHNSDASTSNDKLNKGQSKHEDSAEPEPGVRGLVLMEDTHNLLENKSDTENEKHVDPGRKHRRRKASQDSVYESNIKCTKSERAGNRNIHFAEGKDDAASVDKIEETPKMSTETSDDQEFIKATEEREVIDTSADHMKVKDTEILKVKKTEPAKRLLRCTSKEMENNSSEISGVYNENVGEVINEESVVIKAAENTDREADSTTQVSSSVKVVEPAKRNRRKPSRAENKPHEMSYIEEGVEESKLNAKKPAVEEMPNIAETLAHKELAEKNCKSRLRKGSQDSPCAKISRRRATSTAEKESNEVSKEQTEDTILSTTVHNAENVECLPTVQVHEELKPASKRVRRKASSDSTHENENAPHSRKASSRKGSEEKDLGVIRELEEQESIDNTELEESEKPDEITELPIKTIKTLDEISKVASKNTKELHDLGHTRRRRKTSQDSDNEFGSTHKQTTALEIIRENEEISIVPGKEHEDEPTTIEKTEKNKMSEAHCDQKAFETVEEDKLSGNIPKEMALMTIEVATHESNEYADPVEKSIDHKTSPDPTTDDKASAKRIISRRKYRNKMEEKEGTASAPEEQTRIVKKSKETSDVKLSQAPDKTTRPTTTRRNRRNIASQDTGQDSCTTELLDRHHKAEKTTADEIAGTLSTIEEDMQTNLTADSHEQDNLKENQRVVEETMESAEETHEDNKIKSVDNVKYMESDTEDSIIGTAGPSNVTNEQEKGGKYPETKKYHPVAKRARRKASQDSTHEEDISKQHPRRGRRIVAETEPTVMEEEVPSSNSRNQKRKVVEEKRDTPNSEQEEEKVEANAVKSESENAKISDEDTNSSLLKSQEQHSTKKCIKRPFTASDTTCESAEPVTRRSRQESHATVNDGKNEEDTNEEFPTVNSDAKLEETSEPSDKHEVSKNISDVKDSDKPRKALTRRKAAAAHSNEENHQDEKSASRSRRGQKVHVGIDPGHQADQFDDQHGLEEKSSIRSRRGRKAYGKDELVNQSDNSLDQDEKSSLRSRRGRKAHDDNFDEDKQGHDEKPSSRSKRDHKSKDDGERGTQDDHSEDQHSNDEMLPSKSRRGDKLQGNERTQHDDHTEEVLDEKLPTRSRRGHYNHGPDDKASISSRRGRKAKDGDESDHQVCHTEDQHDHDEKPSVKSSRSNKALEDDKNANKNDRPKELQGQGEMSSTRSRRGRKAHDVVEAANQDDHLEAESKPTRRRAAVTHEESAPASRRRGAARKKDDHEKELNANISCDDIKSETKESTKRNNRRKNDEPREVPSTLSEEPSNHPSSTQSLQAETKSRRQKDSPSDHDVSKSHTSTASQLDHDANVSHTKEEELNTTSEDSPNKRGRDVPQRRAATHHHSYDETSDSDKPEKRKKKAESPRKSLEPAKNTYFETIVSESSSVPSPTLSSSAVTARGRTRKPTARVQQFLEEERAKAETPKKRAALAAAVDTPTKGKPLRRGTKTVTDTEVKGTPQSNKQTRGRPDLVADENKGHEGEQTTPPTTAKGRKVSRKAKADAHTHSDDTEEPPAKKSPAELEAEKDKVTPSKNDSNVSTPTRVAGRRNAAAAAKFRIEEDALATAAIDPPKKSRARKQPAKAETIQEKRDHRLVSASTVEDEERTEQSTHAIKEETKTAIKRGGTRRAAAASTDTTDSSKVELPAKKSRRGKAATETHESDTEPTAETKPIRSAAKTRGGLRNVHFESADQNKESAATDEPATTKKRATRVRRI